MANPKGHVVIGEEEVRQAQERYAVLEAELQGLRQCNEEFMCGLQEQQLIVAAEWLRVDCKGRAQMQEFVNLMAELLAR